MIAITGAPGSSARIWPIGSPGRAVTPPRSTTRFSAAKARELGRIEPVLLRHGYLFLDELRSDDSSDRRRLPSGSVQSHDRDRLGVPATE